MADRMLFATDSMYGRGGGAQHTERVARFLEDFFHFVGRKYFWGAKAEAFLSGTAKGLMAQVGAA